MSKCDDCNLFHNSKCWKPGGKRLWKGKDKELSNKKQKSLHDAGSSVQANMIIKGKFVALQTEHEDNDIDSNVNVSTGS
jgi:hypothetical protein